MSTCGIAGCYIEGSHGHESSVTGDVGDRMIQSFAQAMPVGDFNSADQADLPAKIKLTYEESEILAGILEPKFHEAIDRGYTAGLAEGRRAMLAEVIETLEGFGRAERVQYDPRGRKNLIYVIQLEDALRRIRALGEKQ